MLANISVQCLLRALSTLPRKNLKNTFPLWKRIKCFLFALNCTISVFQLLRLKERSWKVWSSCRSSVKIKLRFHSFSWVPWTRPYFISFLFLLSQAITLLSTSYHRLRHKSLKRRYRKFIEPGAVRMHRSYHPSHVSPFFTHYLGVAQTITRRFCIIRSPQF